VKEKFGFHPEQKIMLGWIAYQCGGRKKPITVDGDEYADVSSLLLLLLDTAPCSRA
jgi:hypothetical protein